LNVKTAQNPSHVCSSCDCKSRSKEKCKEKEMAKQKDPTRNVTDIAAFQPSGTVTVLSPDSGVVGQFLDETRNVLKARAMRMNGLLRRINESGQRTEALLRTAAERMEAAECALQDQFRNEGLLP
jgi:hypothetical protein